MLTNFMYPSDVGQRLQYNTNNASHEFYLSLRQISSKNYKTLYTVYKPTINKTKPQYMLTVLGSRLYSKTFLKFAESTSKI